MVQGCPCTQQLLPRLYPAPPTPVLPFGLGLCCDRTPSVALQDAPPTYQTTQRVPSTYHSLSAIQEKYHKLRLSGLTNVITMCDKASNEHGGIMHTTTAIDRLRAAQDQATARLSALTNLIRAAEADRDRQLETIRRGGYVYTDDDEVRLDLMEAWVLVEPMSSCVEEMAKDLRTELFPEDDDSNDSWQDEADYRYDERRDWEMMK